VHSRWRSANAGTAQSPLAARQPLPPSTPNRLPPAAASDELAGQQSPYNCGPSASEYPQSRFNHKDDRLVGDRPRDAQRKTMWICIPTTQCPPCYTKVESSGVQAGALTVMNSRSSLPMFKIWCFSRGSIRHAWPAAKSNAFSSMTIRALPCNT
jgi:hypothetical protein